MPAPAIPLRDASTPVKSDGSSCDDGNACTLTDVCVQGSCVGSGPVTCWAVDQCHDAGTCDPATGVCSDPARLDGSSRDDFDGCTHGDTCQAGACVGSVSGDARRAGPVPRGGDLRQLHRPLLESDEGERFGMQRRKRMLARGRLPGGHVRRHGARDVCRARRVSRRRLRRFGQRRVLESGEAGRRLLRGRQRVQLLETCDGAGRCLAGALVLIDDGTHAPSTAAIPCWAPCTLLPLPEPHARTQTCATGARPATGPAGASSARRRFSTTGTPAPRMRATRGSESCIRRLPDAGCCRRIPRPSHRPAI